MLINNYSMKLNIIARIIKPRSLKSAPKKQNTRPQINMQTTLYFLAYNLFLTLKVSSEVSQNRPFVKKKENEVVTGSLRVQIKNIDCKMTSLLHA